MQRYEQHIGKRKACPSHCPVCGASTANPYTGNDGLSMLKWMYTWPNRVVRRNVPGWEGVTTWWFECDHENPMNRYIYARNPLLAWVKKTDSFCGKSYPLPLIVTYNKDK